MATSLSREIRFMSDDLIDFMDEEDSIQETETTVNKRLLKVLVVDDEEDMHSVTRLSLKGLSFDIFDISLIHAYSGHEAYQVLQEQADIAVILLDVVMESDFAGLDLVQKIREELHLEKLRIILRTGQPGNAPEVETIEKYNINDYRSKTELSREQLYACIMTALRSYDQLERLDNLAFKDALTQVYNRNGLIRLLDFFAPKDGFDYSLVIINIDQFSALNDNFGPLHGDNYLKILTDKLSAIHEITVLARLNSDQFAFLVQSHEKDIPPILDKIRQPLMVNTMKHEVQFGSGIALWNSKVTSTELIAHATIALKKAKQTGINQDVVFTDYMIKVLRERSQMLSSLQQDFQKNRLFMVYQPQLNLSTNTVIGAEALVRWQDASGHMVSPDVFIELAEQSGFIINLGEWILRKTFSDCKPLLDKYPDFRIGVNVSALQFLQSDFVNTVTKALKEQNIQGHNVNLEITESIGVLEFDDLTVRLKQLKELGISISIDDFGTGFSNLSYLENLHIDRLKIDKIFVSKLETQSGRSIIEMIINLGKNLKMNVLAEGVETERQQSLLLDMGCVESQGFLHSHPISLKQLEIWLHNRIAST